MRTASQRLRNQSAGIAIALAAMLLFASSALAARPGPYSVPSFNGTASVTLTGTWKGEATWDYSRGGYCVYLQHKHVARVGVDGTWNRLTPDSCSTSRSGPWSRPTNRPFNLQKFRLCQNKPNALDPCGSSITTGKDLS